MPWQHSTIRGITSLQAPNEWGERIWTHRDVCIEATRQQGKTLIVVLLILFYLFVAPVVGRSRPLKIVYTAQRWSTAKDVFDRTVKIINRVPYLRHQLKRRPSTRDNHGVIEVIVERGETPDEDITATCEFAPRSQEFGRGVTELDILFIDEAYDVDPGIENDLTGAQSASENPQTIYLSTPPVFAKHPKCHSLADMHRLGHAKAPMLFYRLFAAPRHLSRDDPAAWAAAQPSYGIATNEREIWSKRQKARTTIKKAIFDADYCGWGDYPPPELDGETEIPAGVWDAQGPMVPVELIGARTIAIERSPERDLWAIVGSQRTTDGRVRVELGYCRAASQAEVVDRLVDVLKAWKPAALVIRLGSSAAELVPLIEAKRVTEKFKTEITMAALPDVAAACGGFLDTALAHGFSHGNQTKLNDGVAAAVKKSTPRGGFVWDVADEASYAQLMAASLAHWALMKFGKPRRKRARPGGAVTRAAAPRRESNVMEMSF